jgi:uncharacterized low-complexity protein
MTRWLTVLALGLAMGLAAPSIHDGAAYAQAKKAAKSGLKQCRAKAPGGKVMTWKCKADQPCCMNVTTGQGVCGSPIIGCL